MKLNVVNELGQIVKTISLHNTEINVQDLKPGIYFVTGTNSGRIVNQKVVVTN
ncbi:MAG: T9SS type A sorting domain-containing protein [Bacteroidia bacterium]|nr:T9SS type A sorting domain-containing protein [Bacteroidia bacterium]